MSILNRLKEARLVRVIAVYLGASWVVVEAADLLQEALSLPDWVVPVTIVLLLAGLVVVGATAWVQASPATDRAEAAGEVPTDWEVDLSDLARSIRRGRFPHLTWGRAILGGIVAFLAMFGLAALLIPGVSGPELGPRNLEASEAAPGLAVLPFRVTGEELGPWREAMVDLLSRNLDGLGGLRAIDSRTTLARWNETVGDADADLDKALEAARRAGARWALLGTAVDVGSAVRVTADVHDAVTGARLDGVRMEGRPDSVAQLVDALSIDVARILLEEENPDLTALRISSITTESPAALSGFLEGEAEYRRSRFESALDAYQRALEIDPGFALAHFRTASARGWISLPGALEARQAAYEHRDRLPAREALMVEAEYRARRGALPSGVALLREGVRRYPDDPELWYQLGDISLHWGGQLGVQPEEAGELLERAVALDPGFAPYQIHLVELAMASGDSAKAARLLDRERAIAGGIPQVEAHQLQFDFLYGSEADRERALQELQELDARQLLRVSTVWTLSGEKSGEMLTLARRVCDELRNDGALTLAGRAYTCFRALMASGRIGDARELAAELMASSAPARGPAVLATIVARQTGLDPDAPVAPLDGSGSGATRDDEGGVVTGDLLMAGFQAVQQGRDPAVDSVVQALRAEAEARRARQDTVDARMIGGMAEGIEGFRQIAAGQLDAAIDHLSASERFLSGSTGPEDAFRTLVVWPLAEALAARGRHRQALEFYETLWNTYFASPALARRIDMHEALGQEEEADRLRLQFLRLWAEGDADHPLLEQVRRGLPPG